MTVSEVPGLQFGPCSDTSRCECGARLSIDTGSSSLEPTAS